LRDAQARRDTNALSSVAMISTQLQYVDAIAYASFFEQGLTIRLLRVAIKSVIFTSTSLISFLAERRFMARSLRFKMGVQQRVNVPFLTASAIYFYRAKWRLNEHIGWYAKHYQ